jgi:hypothetical protein
MLGTWRSVARGIGGFLAVAVVVASLLAGGHHHGADQTRPSDTCALCMVKSDSPAAAAAPVPQLAPVLHTFAVVATAIAVPSVAYRPFKPGRAPPLHLPIQPT